MTVGKLFASGPIEFTVLGIKGNQVRVGISADKAISVLRDELVREASG